MLSMNPETHSSSNQSPEELWAMVALTNRADRVLEICEDNTVHPGRIVKKEMNESKVLSINASKIPGGAKLMRTTDATSGVKDYELSVMTLKTDVRKLFVYSWSSYEPDVSCIINFEDRHKEDPFRIENVNDIKDLQSLLDESFFPDILEAQATSIEKIQSFGRHILSPLLKK